MTRFGRMFTGIALVFAAPLAANAQQAEALAAGAQAWARTCSRCHNARPSAERTDRQWSTIVAHMRARANLTKTDARNITLFLQATNAPESAVTNVTPTQTPTDEINIVPVDLTEPERQALLLYLRTLLRTP